MAYFNNDVNNNFGSNFNNASFYPTPSTSAFEEFDAYPLDAHPFLNHTSATEEVDLPDYRTFDNRWGMVARPGPMVGSPTNPQAMIGYESVAPATPYTTQAGGYSQPSYPGNYWPEVGQQTLPQYSGFLSRDASFASTVASETSTVRPAPSSIPLDYWGETQSGYSTSTFYGQNMRTSYQPSAGPSRTGPIQMGRFQPYGMSRVRPSEHRNAEAGPSTLVVPPAPYLSLPTLEPSGGISETTADAENKQTTTEEDKIPGSKRAKLPRGQGKIRRYRKRSQKDAAKLCSWAKRWEGLSEVPSLNMALATAAEIITIRPLVHLKPRLLTKEGKRTEPGSKNAEEERNRRDEERRLLQDLSRYYPLEEGKEVWTRPKLLLRVLEDMEGLPAPPGPSNELPSQASTPTADV